MTPLLSVAGQQVPRLAGLRISQTYEEIGGFVLLRMMNGAGVKQSHWKKVRTVISGDGWIPAGLQSIDYSAPVTIKCVAPRSVYSDNPIIALPAGRRADAAPYAFAIAADGSPVNAQCVLAGDELTITAVAGAIGYVAHFFPELVCFADPPSERHDSGSNQAGWELTAEEV